MEIGIREKREYAEVGKHGIWQIVTIILFFRIRSNFRPRPDRYLGAVEGVSAYADFNAPA